MQVPLLNLDGKEVGTRTVLESWERRPVVRALLHQAVVTADANARIPWAHTKGRGEVRGGGKKPWRQKGTGRARHGSIRSPIWKGGGATFGPRKERRYAKRMPETMKRVALGMSVVTKVRDQEFRLVEGFPAIPKTKELAAFLGKLGLQKSVLMSPPADLRSALLRAGRNLPGVVIKAPQDLTTADILRTKHLLMTPESWGILERRIAAARNTA